MAAYYNEHDPQAAAWLRELIKQGHIAPGEVDERDIRDIRPDELRGFVQCHFFAGIGVWSHALRQAGWPDDRPVWTGSCPCQPFSAAGKGGGFDDERHLWPDFFWLICQGKPRSVPVFGEQVASKDGLAWLDLVQADLEGSGYAFGAVDLCAAGVGAPHIRQRLYWVADAGHRGECSGLQMGGTASGAQGEAHERERFRVDVGDGLDISGMADAERESELRTRGCGAQGDGTGTLRRDAELGGLEHAESDGREQGRAQPIGGSVATRCESIELGNPESHDEWRVRESGAREWVRIKAGGPGPTNGFWRDAEWIYCRDEKWRAVEPGLFPLAYGAPARVALLRGAGNAIVGPQAQAFIEAYLGGGIA